MKISLSDVLPLANLEQYKIHFATWDQKNQPLDVFTKIVRSGRGGRNTGPVETISTGR